ncbi:Methylxanthine N1-demethylase NdmA (plasmid) [Rhodococcus ruber]|uniref:aromatic ring-hydroxylating dioxygenase subunit alpha n=1 Tax=Rhodococcus ruber TaxID=1830 RepID=UPI00315DDBB9
MYAPAAIPDYDALRSCWHPVGHSSEVGKSPHRTQLLNEQLVIWRDSAGTPHAMADLCIHRGTALSIGEVVGDEIMCPYHGWRYGTDGACTAIPQLEDPTSKIPTKARIPSYHCQERYGLIWVAFEEPRWPIPEVPEVEDDAFTVIHAGPYPWAADASRQLENFTDFGHFSWVHPGLLGDPDRPVVGRYTVNVDDHVLRYEVTRPEARRHDEFPVFANEQLEAPERRSRYELHLPYTIVMRHDWGGKENSAYIFASQPVHNNLSRGFLVVARNYAHDQDPEMVRKFEDTIFGQDKRIVETQRPEHVPFDLADELHLSFDMVAVNYRKVMREHGLAKKTDPVLS